MFFREYVFFWYKWGRLGDKNKNFRFRIKIKFLIAHPARSTINQWNEA